jgi:hypothetical protein
VAGGKEARRAPNSRFAFTPSRLPVFVAAGLQPGSSVAQLLLAAQRLAGGTPMPSGSGFRVCTCNPKPKTVGLGVDFSHVSSESSSVIFQFPHGPRKTNFPAQRRLPARSNGTLSPIFSLDNLPALWNCVLMLCGPAGLVPFSSLKTEYPAKDMSPDEVPRPKDLPGMGSRRSCSPRHQSRITAHFRKSFVFCLCGSHCH